MSAEMMRMTAEVMRVTAEVMRMKDDVNMNDTKIRFEFESSRSRFWLTSTFELRLKSILDSVFNFNLRCVFAYVAVSNRSCVDREVFDIVILNWSEMRWNNYSLRRKMFQMQKEMWKNDTKKRNVKVIK